MPASDLGKGTLPGPTNIQRVATSIEQKAWRLAPYLGLVPRRNVELKAGAASSFPGLGSIMSRARLTDATPADT